MLRLTKNEHIGGGFTNYNLVVLVDETYITKKKHQRGGFAGRTTVGHKIIVLGFFEFDISGKPRHGIGRAFLIEILDTKKSIIATTRPPFT